MAAPVTTTPPHWKLPAANSHAAQMLINRPRNVSTLGWIFDSASQRTMALMMEPKNHPIARVAVISLHFVVDGGELADLERFGPPGVTTLTSSPTSLLSRVRPMGDVVETLPLGASASSDRKSTRLNSSHLGISYAVFCL